MTAGMAITSPLHMQKVIYFFKFFFRSLFVFSKHPAVPACPYRRRIYINDIFTKITTANGCFAGTVQMVRQLIQLLHKIPDGLFIKLGEITRPVVLIS